VPAVFPFDETKAKEHQAAWAKYLGVPAEMTNSVGMKFILIPPGKFLMGSTDMEILKEFQQGVKLSDARQHPHLLLWEIPQHLVRITKPFYLGKYEVTQAEYTKVMGTNPSHFCAAGGGAKSVAGLKTERFPVETANWEDAEKFLAKLAAHPEEKAAGRVYRLPTEAERKYACRAGTTTRYFFGDDYTHVGDSGWTSENSEGRTHPVGEKKPNPFGLYDLCGNVGEWCADQFSEDFYARSPRDDPSCTSGYWRNMQGTCWAHAGYADRSEARGREPPDRRGPWYGFRAVCEIGKATQDATKGNVEPAPDAAKPTAPELLISDRGLGVDGGGSLPALAVHGDTLLVGGASGTARLWSIGEKKTLLELKGHTAALSVLCFSSDGRSAASTGMDKTIRVWDLKTGKELLQLADDHGPSCALAWLDRERSLLSVGLDNVIRLWSLTQRKEVRSFRGHTAHPRGLSASPDGTHLVSGSWAPEQTIRLWNLRSGRCIRTMTADGLGCVTSLAFLPNGREALSGSYDFVLRLWDLESGKVVREFKGHNCSVWCVDVSPDGQTAVSGASQYNLRGERDAAVRLWDIASGREIAAYREFNEAWVRVVKFSSDGRSVYSIDDLGRVVRWPVPERRPTSGNRRSTGKR
jgi:formylglycine-generating enzyme required for sulfatase activity